MAAIGIGERLRNARQALGLSLEEIESTTRIRRAYLEALEREAFGDLPNPAYIRGFLRSYATYLGIPPDELLGLYPGSGAGLTTHPDSAVEVRITPATRFSRTRRVVVGLGIVVGLGVLILGYVLYGQIRQFTQTAPGSQPGSPAPPDAAPGVSPPPGPPGPPGTAPPAPAPGSPAPGPPPPGGPAPPSAPLPKAPAPAPGPTGGGAAPAAEPAAPLTSPIHIVVMASGYSWVRAVVDGTTVFEGFLNAGDKQAWEAAHDLTVKVGNAGAIEVSVNGRSLGRLGGSGQVIERTLSVGSVPR
ncbi:MAG TPA: RodZ domain-containing protein [bacterium]|nr:RodZ domain-containing protein [bacterium]